MGFYSSESCHLSEYTLEWFGGLFGARPENFPPFKQVWSLGFLCRTLRHFWSVYLFDVLKRNSTLCQLYWAPNLQSLKFVCFMVANIWKQKYADSRLFVTWMSKWRCLLSRRGRHVKIFQILLHIKILLQFVKSY